MPDNTIDKTDLQRIFNSNENRHNYIQEIDDLEIDKNKSFYIKYIKSNYKTNNLEKLIDILDLAGRIKYNSPEFLSYAYNEFWRRKFWYRLSFLDFILDLKDKLSNNDYKKKNTDIYLGVSNLEIKFQAALNLYSVFGNNSKEILSLVQKGAKAGNHYLFYRIINQESDWPKSKEKIEILQEALLYLNRNAMVFNESQHDYLTKSFAELLISNCKK
jgi:hypothetical protein